MIWNMYVAMFWLYSDFSLQIYDIPMNKNKETERRKYIITNHPDQTEKH